MQALRAVAVAIVVVYHLWPGALPGGFVGVDVFFVISGFLITGQLMRELDRAGRVRLIAFWARRARRLVPVAFLVLAVVVLGMLALVPEAQWQQDVQQIGGSALYVQNWTLISEAVNYFSSANGASPVQHFWSLSVEEQFYLLWPVLLLLPWLLPLRVTVRRRVTIVAVVTGTVASALYGVVSSVSDPSVAYLSTGTRAWEFGVGGLLALVIHRIRLRPRQAAALSWAGLAAIGVSAIAFSDATPFPGTAAFLPVGGAIAVIAAGLPVSRRAPSRFMTHPRVQWLGDASYSLYLWHWPLIVLVPLALAKIVPGYGHAGAATLVGVAILSLFLAWLSTRFIDSRVRRARILTDAAPRRSLALMAGAMVLVVAASGSIWLSVQQDTDGAAAQAASLLGSMPDCLGATALTVADPTGESCTNAALNGVLVPSLVSVTDDLPDTCIVGTRVSKPSVCTAGVPVSESATTVALVGDSHAAQWLPALDALARQNNWHIVMILKGSCGYSDAVRNGSPDSQEVTSCTAWNAAVRRLLPSIPDLSAVFTSADVKDLYAADGDTSGYASAVKGYQEAWQSLPAQVSAVYVLHDTPRPVSSLTACLNTLSTAVLTSEVACASTRTAALEPDPLADAATRAIASGTQPRVRLLDLSDSFCSSTQCQPVIGHVLVYRDQSHMTATYSATLAAALGQSVAESDAAAGTAGP